MFISALIDVAGHAGNLDAAFEVLQEARTTGMLVEIMPYSSLMGTCIKVCPAESTNLFRYCFCPSYLFIC